MPCSADCPFCAPQPSQDARAIAALRGDVAGLRLMLHAALDVAAARFRDLERAQAQIARLRGIARGSSWDEDESTVDAAVTEA